MVAYASGLKKQNAVVENDFWRIIFQSGKLLIYTYLNHSFVLFWTTFPPWVKTTAIPIYERCFPSGDFVQVLTSFCFQSFVQRFFSRHPVDLSGDFVPVESFYQTCCLATIIPVIGFPRDSVTIKRELVPLDFFSQKSSYIHLISFK